MVERFKGSVSEGMQVKGSDGEKLGKVVACQPGGFVVEKGFLFPKDMTVPYERITSIGNGEILISLSRADLSPPGSARAAAGAAAGTAVGAVRAGASGAVEDLKAAARNIKETAMGAASSLTGNGETAGRATFDQFGKAGEITVPLVEEEIVASKHVEKVGEVHVRKEIITEEKQVTVPVLREVLRVERVPVNHEVRAGDRPFEKESYDIPISEEHITIEKHAVVHEEVRIGKDIQQAEETASATVRRERAEVETKGTVRRVADAANDQSQLRPTGTGR
jgi:uncharacterized protein (TIGR02271 family)